jgi:hypothetical protein
MRELKNERYGGSNYAEYVDGILVARHQLNKRELAAMQRRIAAEAPPVAQSTDSQDHARRVELASRASGLPHGRSWVADGWTVDKHSLPPEWEGMLVCYVYGG